MNEGGVVMRAAHYPGRAPIDSYGNGGFRFAGMSHRGSLLCLPSGIYAWDAPAPGALDANSLAQVFAEAEAVEILLVGMGVDVARLRPRFASGAAPRGSWRTPWRRARP